MLGHQQILRADDAIITASLATGSHHGTSNGIRVSITLRTTGASLGQNVFLFSAHQTTPARSPGSMDPTPESLVRFSRSRQLDATELCEAIGAYVATIVAPVQSAASTRSTAAVRATTAARSASQVVSARAADPVPARRSVTSH